MEVSTSRLLIRFSCVSGGSLRTFEVHISKLSKSNYILNCLHRSLLQGYINLGIMEDAPPKKSEIANSILAKFQQYSKQKEDASMLKQQEPHKSFGPKVLERTKRKRINEVLHSGITEKDVGITKYISDHKGFTGIIKHRFSDFQVHEIDKDDNIVELTSTEVKPLPDDSCESDQNLLPEELSTQIDKVLTDKDLTAEFDVSDKDKSYRALIHKTIKRVYGPKVYSNTVNDGEKTIIKVGLSNNKERQRWPENVPQFLHFTVAKKNMDTTHFIYLLSKKLRQKPNSFTYAGTKDRRAVTVQRMCVKQRRAEELIKLSFWGVKLGNYEYKSKPLRLGELSGNKFTITIRNLQVEDDIINTAFENLKTTGFINYFGLQRFGSSAVAPTFQIGKAILKKDWKLAVELILKPRPDEKAPDWVKAAREAWWQTRDSGAALRHLNRHQNSIEYKVLKSLKTTPTDFHGALLTIPRNTLLLYLHSYQSYIWNNIISRRIEKFQMTPQVGDLVIVSKDELEEEEEQQIEDDVSCEKVEEEGGDKEEDDTENDEETSEKPALEKRKVIVKPLTAEDVNTTSIFDVVYPLVGYDVEFPKNEMADWYTELLSNDNISIEDLKSKNKLFALYGTYRKPFQCAKDVTWEIVKHDNLDDDLILSDIEKLENTPLPAQSGDGAQKSVVVDFILKPSSYATMALREVMKFDTSVSFHATMTKNMQESGEKKTKLTCSHPQDDRNNSEQKNGDNT